MHNTRIKSLLRPDGTHAPSAEKAAREDLLSSYGCMQNQTIVMCQSLKDVAL